jgi:hypothetical protein
VDEPISGVNAGTSVVLKLFTAENAERAERTTVRIRVLCDLRGERLCAATVERRTTA